MVTHVKYGRDPDLMTHYVTEEFSVPAECFVFVSTAGPAALLAVREDYLDNSTEAKSVSFPHSTHHLVSHCEVHKLF